MKEKKKKKKSKSNLLSGAELLLQCNWIADILDLKLNTSILPALISVYLKVFSVDLLIPSLINTLWAVTMA